MYQLISGRYTLDGASYISYGIQGGGLRYEDISPDRDAVAQLVELCNSEALEETQLYDVVCDFVAADCSGR